MRSVEFTTAAAIYLAALHNTRVFYEYLRKTKERERERVREFRVSIASFRFHRHSFAYSCRYSPRRKDYPCILSRKIARESIIISAMYRPEYRQVHRRVSINRRAEGREEKAEWIRSMGISQENCSECPTMTAATVEGRKENERKAERREQERRYSGKRSAIYGHPSTSRVIATARDSARYSGRPRGCSCTATMRHLGPW